MIYDNIDEVNSIQKNYTQIHMRNGEARHERASTTTNNKQFKRRTSDTAFISTEETQTELATANK